ncbi:MAG: methylated-DNA--[protein]-cysteine S-methyltransferase [Candidatus Thorarchaeota archaeon]|jgi:methylated-DNA-[protein]-cysteine S-methyltransferase
MKFTTFDTELGRSGIVYWIKNNTTKAIQVLLPRSEEVVSNIIRQKHPHAVQSSGEEVSELRSRIQDFFLGKEEGIPLSLIDTSALTPFQLSVLREDHAVPRGKTTSYGRIASHLKSRAVRAVGNALARNPFPLVMPCHRAVRADRSLGGFGGGLDMKKRILSMEGVEFDSSGRVLSEHFLG